MKKETPLYDQIRSKLPLNVACYRNNTGSAYQGIKCRIDDKQGLINLRRIDFGLCDGSSDLIGMVSTVITPEMVGQKVAIFLALEVKVSSKKGSEAQEKFIALVRDQGGIAGVVRNADEALYLINSKTLNK